MVLLAKAESDTSGVAPQGEDGPSANDDGGDSSLIGRIRSMDGRAKIFVVASTVVIVLALTGRFTASSDVDLTKEEAIEIALDHAQFEPDRIEARIFRQGFRLRPVWAVSFSIPDPDNAQEVERLNTVEIDAQTGDVLRVSVDDIDAVDQEDETDGG